MAVAKIDGTGAVVQRWFDVANLDEFAEKYGLSGPEYVEGKPNRGEVFDGSKFVKPEKTKAEKGKEKTDKDAEDAKALGGQAAARRVRGTATEADFIAAVKWAVKQ